MLHAGHGLTQGHEKGLALGARLVLHRAGPRAPAVGADFGRENLQRGRREGRVGDDGRDRAVHQPGQIFHIGELAQVRAHRVPEPLPKITVHGDQTRTRVLIGDAVQGLGVQAVQIGGVIARRRATHLGEGERLAQRLDRVRHFQRIRCADAAQVAGDGDGLIALVAHVADGQRAQPLGQGRAVRAHQQRHVGEAGGVGPKRLEDLDLGAGVGDVVLAPDHMGDLHVDVVHHRRQGVEEQAVLTDQHGVRHGRGVHLGVAAGQILPGYPLALQLEAPVRAAALGLQLRLVRVGQLQRGSVIDGRKAARQLHLAAAVQFVGRLVAGVQAARGLQPRGGLLIAVEALGLVVAFVPGQAEPLQVRLDAALEFLRRTLQVGVVDAQHEGAALTLGEQPVHQCGAHVAHVQASRGGRRETNLDGHGIQTLQRRRTGRSAGGGSQGERWRRKAIMIGYLLS